MKRSVEEIDALLKELRAQRKEAVRRERQADADALAEAQRIIAESVIEFYDGAWQIVDLPALCALLAAGQHSLEPVKELPRDAALKRLRFWRRGQVEGRASQADGGTSTTTPTANGAPADAHRTDS